METDYNWQSAKSSGYRRTAAANGYGWWVSLAMLLSVLVHLALYMVFENIQVKQIVPGFQEVVQLPVERAETVVDDQTTKRLAEEARPAPTPLEPLKEPAEIDEPPPETPDITETIKLTPATDVVTNLFTTPEAPPLPGGANLPDLAKSIELGLPKGSSAADIKNQLAKASQAASANQPTIYVDEGLQVGVDTDKLVEKMTKQAGQGVGKAILSKFSSLDTLIGEGIQTPSAEVLIPTDLLFEFASYEIKDEAKLSLMKLGMVILANKDATFIFKGFTDSIPFGTATGPGPRNNEELSRLRAEAVRGWLVSQLGLQGYDLQAVGYGPAQPLVQPTGKIEIDKSREALNRRVEVEIIMRRPGSPVRAKPISR
ncbi:MAG: OmpA family protein [Verrucomicrobia bacterium]|nr:OmpA family protein [Verrucomicrobiota bacterium]